MEASIYEYYFTDKNESGDVQLKKKCRFYFKARVCILKFSILLKIKQRGLVVRAFGS